MKHDSPVTPSDATVARGPGDIRNSLLTARKSLELLEYALRAKLDEDEHEVFFAPLYAAMEAISDARDVAATLPSPSQVRLMAEELAGYAADLMALAAKQAA